MSRLEVSQQRDGDAAKERARYLDRNGHVARRLRKYTDDLQQVLRTRQRSHRRAIDTMLELGRLSRQALACERCSIWLFDADRSHLKCTVQLTGSTAANALDSPPAIALAVSGCRRYIAALRQGPALAISDVYADPRTLELTGYFADAGVGALLALPIQVSGQLLGVICHEHVGSSRGWSPEEIDFIATAGSLAALALEADRYLDAEHAARESEARFRQLVECLPVIVYEVDLSTSKIEYISPQVVELGGWTSERWMAAGLSHWMDCVHPDDRALVRKRYRLDAEDLPLELVYRATLPDGRTRWIRDTCSAVRDGAAPSMLRGVVCDITSEMELRFAQQELERRRDFMLAHADVHAVVLDRDARVVYVNDYVCRMTGLGRDEFMGRLWFEFTAPADTWPRLLAEYEAGLARGWFETHMQAPLRTNGATSRQVLWTITVLRHTDGSIEGAMALGIDMTHRIRLEHELLQQTKLDNLGRLAAGVAHDFNNLLTVMLAQTERLGDLIEDMARVAPQGAEAKEAQHALCDVLDQASALTRSLLVYGRRDKTEGAASEVDALVRESMAVAASVVGPELELDSSLSSGRAQVGLEPEQVRQMLLNLVGNAADATHGVGSRVTISTRLEQVDTARARRHRSQPGEFVVLTVADDGRGMDQRTLAQVFDPFFTTKDDARGTGLGLAMCHSLVERAGGFIAVDSTPGEGSQFHMYLPIVAAGTAVSAPHRGGSEQPEEQGGTRKASGGGQARILVVDDMAAIRKLLVKALRSVGYQVTDAADVASATQILTTQPVDLLIADANLPDGSGVVLARSARDAQPELKLMLMSGAPESGQGFDATLVKPFQLDDFCEVVSSVLPPPTAPG